jgi:hypothetical protein
MCAWIASQRGSSATIGRSLLRRALALPLYTISLILDFASEGACCQSLAVGFRAQIGCLAR